MQINKVATALFCSVSKLTLPGEKRDEVWRWRGGEKEGSEKGEIEGKAQQEKFLNTVLSGVRGYIMCAELLSATTWAGFRRARYSYKLQAVWASNRK